MMIPVSIAVSIVLGQNLQEIFVRLLSHAISPWQAQLYGESPASYLTRLRHTFGRKLNAHVKVKDPI